MMPLQNPGEAVQTKKLINDGNAAVDEMLDGILAAHPRYLKRAGHPRAIVARDGPRPGKVGERAYDVLWERLFHLKFYEYKDRLSAAWLGTRIKRIAQSLVDLSDGSTPAFLGVTDPESKDSPSRLVTLKDAAGQVLLNRPANLRAVKNNGAKSHPRNLPDLRSP